MESHAAPFGKRCSSFFAVKGQAKTDLSAFAYIPQEQLGGLRPAPAKEFQGQNNKGLYLASVGVRRAFVKLFERQDVRFTKELRMQTELAKHGLGPQVFGYSDIVKPDGKYPAIVSQFAPGKSIPLTIQRIIEGEFTMPDFVLKELVLEATYFSQHATQETLASLKKMKWFFEKYHIDPFDLQFRMKDDGSLLIVDTGQFRTLKPKEDTGSLLALDRLINTTEGILRSR